MSHLDCDERGRHPSFMTQRTDTQLFKLFGKRSAIIAQPFVDNIDVQILKLCSKTNKCQIRILYIFFPLQIRSKIILI